VVDGPADQREVEVRNDVLAYTSEVLKEEVEVTGPIKVVLYVSSSAKDTDFSAKLVDVLPDGSAYNIQEGIQRMRFREGYDKKVWMEPQGVYQVTIDLEATSNVFLAGHRIRIDVTSSNFPRWDRNLNTGGNNYDETAWVVARNTVHHSLKYPSHALLPVIPSSERDRGSGEQK
jgi:putative CocE/NonD family hydrolase